MWRGGDQQRGHRTNQIVAGGYPSQGPGPRCGPARGDVVPRVSQSRFRKSPRRPRAEREGRHRQVEPSSAGTALARARRRGGTRPAIRSVATTGSAGARIVRIAAAYARSQEARVPEPRAGSCSREEVEPDRHDRVDGDETREKDEVARRGPRPAKPPRRRSRGGGRIRLSPRDPSSTPPTHDQDRDHYQKRHGVLDRRGQVQGRRFSSTPSSIPPTTARRHEPKPPRRGGEPLIATSPSSPREDDRGDQDAATAPTTER